jgi:hypothetical protein
MTYCEECKERLYPIDPESAYFEPRTKRRLVPLCQGCPHEADRETESLAERITNLEEISAQPGFVPRAFHDELQQIQGQVTFLQNKLNEALDRGRKRAKQDAAKKEQGKPTYRGLSA